MYNKNYTQKYVYRFKTRKRIIKQAIMTGKQEEQLFKLLTDILWTLKKMKKDRVVRSKPFNK